MKFYSHCAVETALNLVGNKWKLLIVYHLLSGTKRFGELKKSVTATKHQTISQNVLAQNLRALEEANIIHRKVYAEVPPRVEYSLTDFGQQLKIVIESLQTIGETYQTNLRF